MSTAAPTSPAGAPRQPDTAGSRVRPVAVSREKVAKAIWWNWFNSILLAVLLTLIGMAFAYVIVWAIHVYLVNDTAPSGQEPGLFAYSNYALAGALAMALFGTVMTIRALVKGDVVMMRIVGAREVSESDEPGLHAAAAKVAAAAGMIKPRLVVIESPALNAFAAGRDEFHATVGVTRGLLKALTPEELEGVLGHEIGHIANRDIVYADIVALCLGLTLLMRDVAITTARIGFEAKSSESSSSSKKDGKGGAAALAILVALAVLLIAALVAPMCARLVQMAVSRQREFGADAAAAYLCGTPDGLASALEKIDASDIPLKVSEAVQHVFIVNPLRIFTVRSRALLSTHPTTWLRIERLRALTV